MDTLGDALPREMARVRALKAIYDGLPNNAGKPAAFMMEKSLQCADKAIIEGDLSGMIMAFKDLKEFTG